MAAVMKQAEGGALLFRCPGCDEVHQVWHGIGQGPRWAWNGNLEKPTLTPSIRVTGVVPPKTEEAYREMMLGEIEEPERFVCHSFIIDGQIRYLPDCTHKLAGASVDLPPWEKP